ncbi:hypothetical protein [Acinetobacter brisouii]|uniref:hypothetical protein n=1 Tax=Acinetobacter brisouii TaxID=396323 RepID=UPI00124C4974|nr:hypothetical protein [Acinetobacter brisouii]
MNVLSREPRMSDGKTIGEYVTFEDGAKLYLHHYSGEKNRNLIMKHNAWALPTRVIREAERLGCAMIGIRHKVGKKLFVYMVRIQDFLDAPSEIHYAQGKEPMRRLNRNRFTVSTTKTEGYIESRLKIR